jgi:hypothetical protein
MFATALPALATRITGVKAAMGIWIELGIFLLAIAFGFWQLRDVKKAQAERRARERAAALSETASKGQHPGASGS